MAGSDCNNSSASLNVVTFRMKIPEKHKRDSYNLFPEGCNTYSIKGCDLYPNAKK